MAEGTSTLPAGLPKLSLGPGALAWANNYLVQPNGPLAGRPWTPTDDQARFIMWWYAVDGDGRWLFHHGVRRLAKGSGKSPFAAVMALMELCGPVRLDDFDSRDRFGCVGRPVDMPLVQIAATAESQTANTMRMVRAMASKQSRVVRDYTIDVGKTVFYTAASGQLEVITSSASAAEGAEVTFAVEDETEHWVAATGGPTLAATIDRNLAKSSSRAVETANAWEPGIGSVAEATFDAWQAQQEGRTRGSSRILYDARVAPADVDLADEASLTAGLAFVYEDCFWVDQRTIKERIWDPRTLPDVARRFYLNQPTATSDAWSTPMEWEALRAGPDVAPVTDGDTIVMFFDGSKSRDATGLVGCRMSDGHVFHIGSWEPDPNDPADEVPTVAVDATVARAFERWDVVAFFADVKEWEGFVKVNWPDLYGKGLLVHAKPTGTDPQSIAWDMRSHDRDFTLAAELTEAEIREKAFTHDGNAAIARHVVNARRRLGRFGISIAKESKDSPKKIDLAVCVIGARLARRTVLASKEWERRQRRAAGRGRIVVLQ